MEKILALWPEKIKEIDVEKSDLNSITDGILFVFARWSAPSKVNIISKIHDLKDSRYDGSIYITDHDRLSPDRMEQLFGRILHGYGEMFYIRQGIIMVIS